MDVLHGETSIAEGEQALQALLPFARDSAGKLEAHEAEKGIFKRLLPMGLAAMKCYFARRGTGEIRPAIARADGVILPREQALRGRNYFSRLGQCAVPHGLATVCLGGLGSFRGTHRSTSPSGVTRTSCRSG